MDSYNLVEVRKGEAWNIAVLERETDLEAFVFLTSASQSQKVLKKDFAQYRTNTSKDQGLKQIIHTFSFIDFNWILAKIEEAKKNTILSSNFINQVIRGKIFLSLFQILEFYSSYPIEQVTGYLQLIKHIAEFYLQLLDSKILIRDGPLMTKNVGVACLGEIETVIRVTTGLDEPGKTFFSYFLEKVHFPIVLPYSTINLCQHVKIQMIHKITSVVNYYKNLDELPFIDLFSLFIQDNQLELDIDLETVKVSIRDHFEQILHVPDQIDLKGREIFKIYSNLVKFQVSEGKVCEYLFNFLQKPLTITQKLQVFESLDKINDNLFRNELIKRNEDKYYMRLLEQESFVKYIIKYIKVFIDENHNEFIASIINYIESREVLVSLIKILTSKAMLFNQKEIIGIFTEVIKKYMIDCRDSIICFISSICYNFGENIWLKVFELLANHIPKKEECTLIMMSVLVKEENLGLRYNVLVQLFENINHMNYDLTSAIINSSEFFKLQHFFPEITEVVVTSLNKNNEIFLHLQALVKILDSVLKETHDQKTLKKGPNEKTKKEVFLAKIMKNVLEAFYRCEKNKQTCSAFFTLARETSEKSLITSILRILIENDGKGHRCEFEQNLMLVFFLKLNKLEGKVIVSDDFWKVGFSNISRKSEQKLDFEDEILDVFFNGRVEDQPRPVYQLVFISLYSKFDTSNQWTMQVKTDFSARLLKYPNTKELIQTFTQFFDQDVLPHDSLTAESLKSAILRSENHENLLLFRKILLKTPDNRLNRDSIASILKNTSNESLKLIIIERVVKIRAFLIVYQEHLMNFLSNSHPNFEFGQIIFYILKHAENFKVPNQHFQYFLNSTPGLYKQDSEEQNDCFSTFFDRLKQVEENFQVFILKNCLMSVVQKKVFNVELICSKLKEEAFFSFNQKTRVISAFFLEILDQQSDDNENFNQDIEMLIQALVDDELDLNSSDLNLTNIIKLKSLEKNYLISYVKIAYYLTLTKSFSTWTGQNVLEYYLTYAMDTFFDFSTYSPLILNKSIQSQAMILFSQFESTREKLYSLFTNFFTSFQAKIRSKSLNYKISTSVSPKSLKNFGTTCYINSILQLLYKIHEIKNQILSIQQGSKSLQVLQFILQKLKFSIRKSVNSKKFIENYELYEGVYIEKFNQGDVSEFFNSIIFKLKDENVDILKSLGFQLKTTYICECRNTKSSVQDQVTLDLDLGGEEKLSDLIKSFESTKNLDEGNWALCETCGCKSIKNCKSEVVEWPKYMICVLKRLRFNLETQMTEKLAVECLIENSIELHQEHYEVIFFINHFGTAQEGHYVSYSKRKGTWFEIDDTRVEELPGFEPENKESIPEDCSLRKEFTPYLVLLRKKSLLKAKVQVVPDQKVTSKNLMYMHASVYCGDPIIDFLSNYISINLNESSYFLMCSLPYQQIDIVNLLHKVYQKFAESLESPENRAEFRKIVSQYILNIFEIFTGFSSNEFKLVLSSLILKAFRDNLADLFSYFSNIFALDHMRWDLTFIIEFLVEGLKSSAEKENRAVLVMNYFINRKVDGFNFQIGVQKIGASNFSCFFKSVYSDRSLFSILANHFSLEIFKYFTNFASFQQFPKWLSKIMSRKVNLFNEKPAYLDLINQLGVNIELKQRLVYDLISEENQSCDLFRSQTFQGTLQSLRGYWLNISFLEKIAREFSRKTSQLPEDAARCLKLLVSGKNETISNLPENFRNQALENFAKLEKTINEIIAYAKKHPKKNNSFSKLSFWKSGFKLDSYEDLEIIDDAKKGLILVRSNKN